MAKLKLSVSVGMYDLNQGLADGSVQAEGIDLVVLPQPAPERHRRMFSDLEYDACEVSFSSFLAMKSRDMLPVSAIPAFPLRFMRHSCVFINTQKGIREPKDLNGKRIGVRSWQVTAGLWARGILAEHYGVDLKSIRWVAGDVDDVPFAPPSWLNLETQTGADLDRMLAEGELDACIYPVMMPSVARRDPRVGYLWPDVKKEEMAYWEKTKTIPIMHCVVVKDSVLAEHPWVGISLLKAFQESKARHLQRLQFDNLMYCSVVWGRSAYEEQLALMGPDPFPYDFAASRHQVETACRYSFEQGLSVRRLQPEELFFKPAIKPIPKYV